MHFIRLLREKTDKRTAIRKNYSFFRLIFPASVLYWKKSNPASPRRFSGRLSFFSKGRIIMQNFWEMFTTTLGSAAVIAAITMVFFASRKRSELHKNHKNIHRVLVALLFGALSIYASVSAIEVDGALCNCRNLAPLYAGLVAGPVGGIGAALIGGLFRYFVYGGASALPCMLACFLAGILGSVLHLVVKKEYRYNILTGLGAVLVTEGCHMGLLCAFGLSETAAKIALPIILANLGGMAFCLFLYRRCNESKN